jgi:hypothetical protein
VVVAVGLVGNATAELSCTAKYLTDTSDCSAVVYAINTVFPVEDAKLDGCHGIYPSAASLDRCKAVASKMNNLPILISCVSTARR